MKYFRLIWTGLWRKKVRTVFTMLSIIVAFLLFGLLQGIDTTFKHLVDQGRLNVLVTSSPAGLPLPLADLAQIEAVPGVTGLSYSALFIGDYQSLRNIMIVLPIDANFFALNPQFKVSPRDRDAFLRTRTGALVAQSTAERLGWKVGDHIPIQALNARKTDGTATWTFDLVGTFDIPNNPIREEPIVFMNYEYFDKARASDTGTVRQYQVTIKDASEGAAISNQIDNLFANSPNRTHTETERANAQGQLAQFGDLDFFVRAIVSAAFATLLLLTGTTLMQAYRERIKEFAVMKTIGFTDRRISVIVLSEAILLTLGSALLGLLIARVLLPALGSAMSRYGLPGLELPGIVLGVGVSVAVLLALVSALPAAVRAERLSIVDALAMR